MLRFNGRITDGRNIIGDLMDKNNMTSEELKEVVDDHPDFERMLLRIPDDESEE